MAETWFTSHIEPEFSRLKFPATLAALAGNRLPLLGYDGHLEPVGNLHLKDAMLISTLTAWRREHALVYPTQFKVTLEGTADWLSTKVVAVPDRIMFLIVGPDLLPIGHIGFAFASNVEREMKLDNLLRGVPDRHAGIMRSAVKTILDWSERRFSTAQFWAPLFAHNEPALAFLGELGFERKERIPLRRYQQDDRITYKPQEPCDHNVPDAYHIKVVRVSKAVSGLSTKA